MERKSRIAPKEISALIPDAAAVTTDFTVEFYQLFRNKDIKSLKFFVDSDYSEWQPNEFPYIRQINELTLAGVDASFVLDKTINITSCSSSIKTILMSALFQYKFKYCRSKLPGALKPLLTASFNDGTTKTYFGEGINISFLNLGVMETFSLPLATSI